MNARRPIARSLTFLLIAATTWGCASLGAQARQMRVFADSAFRIAAVDDVRLAGVDVRDVRRPSDIGVADVARIVATTVAGTLPFDLALTIEATNRGDVDGRMRQFDWKLRLDDVEVAEGASTTDIRLPVGDVATFPLTVSTDVRDLVKGQSREAIVDVAAGIVDPERRPPRISLMIRPTFEIFGRPVRAPGYVTVPLFGTAAAVGQ
jgi:hypothetical protein